MSAPFPSFAVTLCDGCGSTSRETVRLGAETAPGVIPTRLCRECIAHALEVAESVDDAGPRAPETCDGCYHDGGTELVSDTLGWWPICQHPAAVAPPGHHYLPVRQNGDTPPDGCPRRPVTVQFSAPPPITTRIADAIADALNAVRR